MSTAHETLGSTSSQEMRRRLDRIIGEVLGVDPSEIHDDIAYGAIPGWDSVGHIDLLYALEQAFGIEVTADAIARLTSLRSIEAELLGRPPGQGPGA